MNRNNFLIPFSLLMLSGQLAIAAEPDPDLPRRAPLSSPLTDTRVLSQPKGVLIGSGATNPIDHGEKSIVIGNTANEQHMTQHQGPPQAKGNSDIAIGNSAFSNGDNNGSPAIAIGTGAYSEGTAGLAVGSNATAKNMGSMALGNNASSSNGGISVGNGASSGAGSELFPSSAIIVNDSIAIGRDSKILNSDSNSIAVGAYSSAGNYDENMPAFNSEKITDKSVLVSSGELSVGNKDEKSYRRVTNVSAGAENSDAVNVAQLQVVDLNATMASDTAAEAKISAGTAEKMASEARDSVVTAHTVAREAKVSAATAENTASEARNSALTAHTVAREAKKSASTAEDSAVEAKVSATNSSTVAAEARGSAATAERTAVDAINSATRANTIADRANRSAEISNAVAAEALGKSEKNARRIESLDKEMKQGLASSAALSGLFQPYGIGNYNLTMGVGGYGSDTAVAVGSGYRFTEKVAVKGGVSTSTSDAKFLMYNISANFEW